MRETGEMGMIDIKFVIKGLEDAKDVIRKSELTGSKKIRLIDACCNAVTLLKEQPQIVRCKDCKHRPTYPEAYGAEIDGKWCYWCELHRSWKHDDWYCADGERKEGL